MKKILLANSLCVVVFILFGCSSENRNAKIEKVFEKTHESEIREAITTFENYSGNYFYITEKGSIGSDELFLENIERISNLHKEYHLSNALPRSSSDWKKLMYYKKHPNKGRDSFQRLYTTQCPFCIAEENGNLFVDEVDWLKTELFLWKIDERKNQLLSLMKNDDMKKILSEFERYLKTEECFSDKEIPNIDCDFYGINNNQNYYVNHTKKYDSFMNKIETLDRNNHRFGNFKDAGKILSYQYANLKNSGINSNQFNNAISSNDIPCCPICLIWCKKVQDGEITPGNTSFSCNNSDYYFWKPDGFAGKSLSNYIEKQQRNAKEEAKKKQISDMPLYNLKTINEEIRSNRITAKNKYDGKQIKIKAQIDSVYEDKVELLFGPYIFLPKTELEKLKADQYITFIATMKFYDTSSKKSSTNSWEDELDNLLSDLNTLTNDADNGGLGYSFENCKLVSIQ